MRYLATEHQKHGNDQSNISFSGSRESGQAPNMARRLVPF
jgi:hypothetical protein